MTDRPVVLVTGGAAGIGRALVRRFGEEGYRVVVVDRDEAGAEAAAASVSGVALALDLSKPEGSAAAVGAAVAELGRLDVVCLNAGMTTGHADVETLDAERYRQVVALNQDAVFYGVQAALPALRDSGGGTIIATASLGGLVGQPDDPVYCMTKHAVVGLVRSLAVPLDNHGVRIFALCPGFVDTPLMAPYLAAFVEAKFPLLRPDDVADAALHALHAGGTGEVWVIQPGREPLCYQFRGVPGPRAEGYDGALPPTLL